MPEPIKDKFDVYDIYIKTKKDYFKTAQKVFKVSGGQCFDSVLIQTIVNVKRVEEIMDSIKINTDIVFKPNKNKIIHTRHG